MAYLTEDEIVADLLVLLKDDDRRDLRKVKKEDLIGLHHGFGTWIRNHYKLWAEDNPHTVLGYVPDVRDGIDHSPRHPDAVSMRVIEKLHRKLQYTT